MSAVQRNRYMTEGNTGYVNGNVVRQHAVPLREQRIGEIEKDDARRRAANRNREKALQMNAGYVFFLAIATIITLSASTLYLMFQSDITNKISNIATLEGQLADLKSDNDEAYGRVTRSVDLEYVKQVAIGELGMVYASEDQVVLYESTEDDYVRQYADIPSDEKSGLSSLLK